MRGWHGFDFCGSSNCLSNAQRMVASASRPLLGVEHFARQQAPCAIKLLMPTCDALRELSSGMSGSCNLPCLRTQVEAIPRCRPLPDKMSASERHWLSRLVARRGAVRLPPQPPEPHDFEHVSLEERQAAHLHVHHARCLL